MTERYFKQRLVILDRLLEGKEDVTGGRFWTIDPASLRFKHGESIADLKVPYHLGAGDEGIIERAVLSVVALLKERFKPRSSSLEQDEGLTGEIKLPSPLKDRTYRTDIFLPDSPEKKLAEEILSTVPYMDSSMLHLWLGPDGEGRNFMRWTTSIFEKALGDETRHGSAEPTAYLLLLAVLKTIRKKREALKEVRIKGISYERLDQTVGLAMFAAFRQAVTDLLDRLRDIKAPYYNPRTCELLLSAIVPRSFLSIPSAILAVSLNPYGINGETFSALSENFSDIERWDRPSKELLYTAVKRIKKDARLLETAREQYGITGFRQHLINYLAGFDLPGVELHGILYSLYQEDRLIKNHLKDQKLLDGLVKDIEKLKKFFSKDPRRVEALDSLRTFLINYRKAASRSIFSGVRRDFSDFIGAVAERYLSCRFDEEVERFTGHMMVYLTDRRTEFDQKTLLEEYNRGRLYRFSSDDRPILRTLEVQREGQLFIDMKGFTRKTFKVKEIAMAEFMKEHFYKPILDAASRYSAGEGVLMDERGIRLNNLPGDAAIFSGGVTNLVSLAGDVQEIIRRYRDEISKRLLPEDIEGLIEDVHRRYEQKNKELKKKRDELNRALRKNEHGLESKLMALGEEEHRMEDTYRDELEAAIVREMEAGLFISYGVKAETMTVESRLESGGPVKVAIGEKINEAARGTFRNPMVRAKLEVLLEKERRRRRNKNLRYPFDVYIDRIYSIRMPPEFDNAIDKLLTNRDPATAQAMAQVLAKEYLDDLKKIISGEPFNSLRLVTYITDIYNKGQAFSEEALEAYMKETRGTRFFFRKTVRVDELDGEIRENFFFPRDPLEFVFGVEVIQGAEVVEAFYRCGEVAFKGFEAATPTVVYEILDREGEFFKALIKHHFQRWKEEASVGEGVLAGT